jgi:hypothetical protein
MADQWYVARNTPQGRQQQGPMPLEQVRQLAHAGALSPQDLVWQDGTPDWVPAGSVAAIFGGIQASPPPLPPTYDTPFDYASEPRRVQQSSNTWIWVVVGVAVVGVLGFLCLIASLVAITTIGTNASQTFSKVGSSINKPEK